jgi:hypothetical protein
MPSGNGGVASWPILLVGVPDRQGCRLERDIGGRDWTISREEERKEKEGVTGECK